MIRDDHFDFYFEKLVKTRRVKQKKQIGSPTKTQSLGNFYSVCE